MLLICLSSSLNKLDFLPIWIFSLSLVYVSSVFVSLAICVTGIGYQLQNSVYVYFNWLSGEKVSCFNHLQPLFQNSPKNLILHKKLLFLHNSFKKTNWSIFLVFQIYSWFLFFYQNYALFRSIGFATKLKSTSAILMNVINFLKKHKNWRGKKCTKTNETETLIHCDLMNFKSKWHISYCPEFILHI